MTFERTYELFKEISKVPRGSGNMQGISDFVKSFAESKGCSAVQDEALNVFVVKEAATGYENEPTMILQAHMDMVCVKEAGSTHDFLKDPIEVIEENGWIHANGTSLGSDDGLGAAMMMALIESSEPMRRLEFIFTTDEETSMGGAQAFDCSVLKGRYLLNLDEEQEGHIVVSCAGHSDQRMRLRYDKLGYEEVNVPVLYTLSVTHLRGGHSGIEIGEGRTNAIKAAGDILGKIKDAPGFRLASFSGGQFFNAIPKEAEIVFFAEDIENIKSVARETEKELKKTEPNARVSLTEKEDGQTCFYSKEGTDTLVKATGEAPHGVFFMHETIPNFVKCSTNFAIVREEDEYTEFCFMSRSNDDNLADYGEKVVASLAEKLDAEFVSEGRGLGWEEKKDSVFVPYVSKKYEEILGVKPEVMGVHAGLECGVWSKKVEGIDCLSMGPTLHSPHTTMETASLESLEHYVRLVNGIIKGKI